MTILSVDRMTTIYVKEDTWKKLNQLKKPGETMDDVVKRLLEIYEEHQVKDLSNNINIENLIEEFIDATTDIDQTIEVIKESWKRQL